MPSTRNCLDSQRKLPESSSSIRAVGKSENLRGKLQIKGLLNEKVLILFEPKSGVQVLIKGFLNERFSFYLYQNLEG
jgi:hypothetical protein